MRTPRRPGAKNVIVLGIVAAALYPLSPAARAAPQQADERRIEHREIVIVEPAGHRRLLARGLARRGFLGVQPLDPTPELRLHLGGPGDRGVLVARVEDDSPAAAAGVRVGDLITGIDGQPLRTAGQLVARIGRKKRDEEVELEIWRDGARLSLRPRLAENERQQLELGQFLWRSDEGDHKVVRLSPGSVAKVISVDPESVNESVSRLIERFEAEGLPGRMRLELEQRQELERRIQELERRLREMEQRLGRREPGAD